MMKCFNAWFADEGVYEGAGGERFVTLENPALLGADYWQTLGPQQQSSVTTGVGA
jgi:hypothetical protein